MYVMRRFEGTKATELNRDKKNRFCFEIWLKTSSKNGDKMICLLISRIRRGRTARWREKNIDQFGVTHFDDRWCRRSDLSRVELRRLYSISLSLHAEHFLSGAKTVDDYLPDGSMAKWRREATFQWQQNKFNYFAIVPFIIVFGNIIQIG